MGCDCAASEKFGFGDGGIIINLFLGRGKGGCRPVASRLSPQRLAHDELVRPSFADACKCGFKPNKDFISLVGGHACTTISKLRSTWNVVSAEPRHPAENVPHTSGADGGGY